MIRLILAPHQLRRLAAGEVLQIRIPFAPQAKDDMIQGVVKGYPSTVSEMADGSFKWTSRSKKTYANEMNPHYEAEAYIHSPLGPRGSFISAVSSGGSVGPLRAQVLAVRVGAVDKASHADVVKMGCSRGEFARRWDARYARRRGTYASSPAAWVISLKRG